MRKTICIMVGVAAAASLFVTRPAWAQHGHTASIVADGSNQLQANWDYDVRAVARLQHLLGGLFNGSVPGLNDGTGNGVDTFTLATGTNVDVELMAIDEGLTWVFTNGTLATPGDTALLGTMPTLHNHPNYNLQAADDKTFAEARVSFRVFDSSPVPVYTASDVQTFRASNGYLPPLEPAMTEDATKALAKCQKTVASTVRGFGSKVYQLLGKCLDAVVAEQLGLEDKPAKALGKCNFDEMDPKSLVSAVAAAKAKAVEKIAKKCGALSASSLPYTESQVYTHLGMAECRAAELAGATYNSAPLWIGEILEAAVPPLGDHDTVIDAFPCMVASTEE